MSPPPPPSRPHRFEALYAHPLRWLIALAAAHMVVRVAISPALKWDEAEQILWTQQLEWGYGAQPPLYTWLQWGVNQLFGPSVLALSLLKQTLIALTYALMWLAARELLGRRAAFWVAAGLLLMPPFGWDSISDQTHTILVTAMTCGAWWLLLRIVRREGRDCRREFAALGLACGCGMLAKYNFALALAALAVALLSVRGPRRALFGRGWWWTLLAGAAVVAPHGLWLLSHWSAATTGTLRVMEIAARPDWTKGLVNLLEAVVRTLGLWAILALAAFRSGWRRRADPAADPAPGAADRPAAWLRPVFGRYLALIGIALLVMVLAGDVTAFKNRWLVPLLAPVPLMAFALRPELDADARGEGFTRLILALALLMLVAAGARPWLGYLDGGTTKLGQPVAPLARALQDAGYDGRGRIIAADHILAGSLRTRFQAAPAAACRADRVDVAACVTGEVETAGRAGQGWLLISLADPGASAWWEQALARIPGHGQLPRGTLRMPFRMARPGHEPARYDFVWHPAQQP